LFVFFFLPLFLDHFNHFLIQISQILINNHQIEANETTNVKTFRRDWTEMFWFQQVKHFGNPRRMRLKIA
jgi:hypothetical protein